MSKGGMTDERLLACLAVVELEQVVQREGGWEASLDWANALSGGDKQRVAAARLFYHKPKVRLLYSVLLGAGCQTNGSNRCSPCRSTPSSTNALAG
jgi:ABC-type uncharacterized transport system ATPase subunit